SRHRGRGHRIRSKRRRAGRWDHSPHQQRGDSRFRLHGVRHAHRQHLLGGGDGSQRSAGCDREHHRDAHAPERHVVRQRDGQQGDIPAGRKRRSTDRECQEPDSPTIDHGANDPANGPSDFEGDARTFNGTTDIGADEFLPAPTAVTGPAMAVAATGATLTGSVNPRGVPTTYRFVYGKTAAYGQSTPVKTAGSGTASQPRSAAIAGLKPATKYHYRIEALSNGGKTVGPDRTFATVDPFKGVILKNQSVVVKKGKAPIKVGCPAITPPPCHGTLKLTFRRTTIDALGHKHKKKIKLGT